MKKTAKVFLIVSMLILTISLPVFALQPTSQFYVNDYTGTLDSSVKNTLVERGAALAGENGVQVVAVIVNNYIGESIEVYANQIFNQFGIGKKGENTGILLMVAVDDGEVRIEVGDGVSYLLPDSKAGSIIDEIFLPYAKAGNLSVAIEKTYLNLIQVGSRYEGTGISRASTAEASQGIDFYPLMMGLIIIVIIISATTSSRRRRRTSGTWGAPGPGPIVIPPPVIRSNRSIFHWGSSSGRSGSSGGGFFGGSGRSFGGGGNSSGGGSSRSFFSGGCSRSSGGSFGGSGHSGGGGSSSGGGASRKF